jgi:thiamine biosynthesis lipoprotein ApbE
MAVSIPADVERFMAMGTRIELHRFGAGGADDALLAARRAIEAVDDALTIHRPSATTALNERLLAGETAPVDDPVLFDALVAIDAVHEATLGLFDPAADRRFAVAGWRGITFDRAAARLYATTPVAFDFGGFGKGFALDRAGEVLRAAGIVSACLSAGESSIAVIGEHPLGGGWPFAVPSPSDPDDSLVQVELIDQSLSISATVGAGTAAPDRAAMLRPDDRAVITAPRCAVAVAPTGALAEAMSTALLVADPDRADRLIDQDRANRFLFDLTCATARASSARMALQ